MCTSGSRRHTCGGSGFAGGRHGCGWRLGWVVAVVIKVLVAALVVLPCWRRAPRHCEARFCPCETLEGPFAVCIDVAVTLALAAWVARFAASDALVDDGQHVLFVSGMHNGLLRGCRCCQWHRFCWLVHNHRGGTCLPCVSCLALVYRLKQHHPVPGPSVRGQANIHPLHSRWVR